MSYSHIIDKVYPGKVLLFGEYTVIHGGDSVAIPLYKKTANWDYDDLEFESRDTIDKFIDFLVLNGIGEVKLESFSKEWKKGLFLYSNIPIGYGAGSSGSLVAAIYDCFMNHTHKSTIDLRKVFIKMENYFHGSSSGLDPLVSFLGKAIHVEKDKVHQIDGDFPILDNLYLWDSGIGRKTAPLVKWYKEQLDKGMKHSVNGELLPLNKSLIFSFLHSLENDFELAFKAVENFQTTYLIPMFPHSIKQRLNRIKHEYSASYKLCGAGGGGFYLIYTNNKEIRNETNIIPLTN